MIQELELQGKEARETIGTLEQRVAKFKRNCGRLETSQQVMKMDRARLHSVFGN